MIADPLLIGLYWLSVVFIGFGFLLISRHIHFWPTITNIASRVFQMPTYIILLVSFLTGSLYFSVLSLPLFFFHLPVFYAVIFYIIAVAASFIVTLYFGVQKAFEKYSWKQGLLITGESNLVYVVSLALLVVMVIDITIAFLTKSNVGGDAIYHMSRVVDIVNNGFNLSSSFFSLTPEGSYHVNVIYTLYAIPTEILHLAPMRIWEFSLPFFRLIQWLMVYTFAYFVWTYWLKLKTNKNLYILLTTIVGYFTISPRLFVATYPNQIVVAWIVLTVIALYFFVHKPKSLSFTLPPLALLITLTHPIYSLMTAVYIASYAGCYGLYAAWKKMGLPIASYIILGVSILILALGPLLTYFTPSMMTTDRFSIGEEVTVGRGLLSIADPGLLAQESKVRYGIVGFTLIAVIYLVQRLWHNKRALIAAVSLGCMPFAVLYIPPLFSLLHKFLPVWVLQRFEAINLLVFVSGFVTIVALLEVGAGVVPRLKKNNIQIFLAITASVMIAALLIRHLYVNTTQYAQQNNITYQQNSQVAHDFSQILNKNTLVITEPNFGYMLASVLDIDVLAVEKGHFPVAADAVNRSQCLDMILKNYRAVDLDAVNADYIMVPRPSADHENYRNVKDKPYIQLAAEDEHYLVYKFLPAYSAPSPKEQPMKSCQKFQENERELLQ